MEYYEKYWEKKIGSEGVAQAPPQWQEHDLRRILNVIQPFCKGRVLDLGCGDGALAFGLSLLENVESVTGIDCSAKAVADAQNKYPGLKFVRGDVTALPFQNDSFDFIAVSEVAEHIVDVQALFEQARRVLKPGGFMLVTTTDFNWPKKIILAAFFWDKYFYPTNPHIRFFTKKTLRRILDKAGFQIKRYLWNGSYFGVMPKGQLVIARKI